MNDSRLPDQFEVNGKLWKQAEIDRPFLRQFPRDDIRALAKYIHKIRQTTFPSLSWIGQSATVEGLITYILGEETKTDQNTPPVEEPVTLPVSPVSSPVETVMASNGETKAALDELKNVFGKLGLLSSDVNSAEVETVVDQKLGAFRGQLIADAGTKITEASTNLLDEVNGLKDEFAQVLSRSTIRVEIITPSNVVVPCGLQHKQMPQLLSLLMDRFHVALVGPAGSGKTRAAEEAAKALDTPFSAVSVGEETTKSELMGYMDAKGSYVRTALRERAENGGILLLDEFDCGNANVATCLNALTANDKCGFPDGVLLDVSKKFSAIASLNTYGTGADRVYVGRNELDGATRDRFIFLDWGYDEALERELALRAFTECGGKRDEEGHNWVSYVQSVRKACEALKLRIIVSPRQSTAGCKLLGRGVFSRSQIEKLTIWKGTAKTEIDKVQAWLTANPTK